MSLLAKTLPTAAAAVALAAGAGACRGGGAPADDTGIPNYEPSTLVSRSTSSRTLQSSAPVDEVSAFYADAMEKGGWETVSKTAGKYSATLTVEKTGHGASISIAAIGLGTSISITTYPTL